MDNNLEQQEAHKNPEIEETTEVETETEEQTSEKALSEEEIAELKRKAEVSSQNFERAKKAEAKAKELEDRIRSLEEANLSDTEFDTGDELASTVRSLKQELDSIKRNEQRKSLESQFPQLVDKKSEFDEYLENEKDLPLDKAAKVFLAEKGLLGGETPKRKGLEKTTGGNKEVRPTKVTSDEARKLRETNYKKYLELVRSGKLKDIN